MPPLVRPFVALGMTAMAFGATICWPGTAGAAVLFQSDFERERVDEPLPTGVGDPWRAADEGQVPVVTLAAGSKRLDLRDTAGDGAVHRLLPTTLDPNADPGVYIAFDLRAASLPSTAGAVVARLLDADLTAAAHVWVQADVNQIAFGLSADDDDPFFAVYSPPSSFVGETVRLTLGLVRDEAFNVWRVRMWIGRDAQLSTPDVEAPATSARVLDAFGFVQSVGIGRVWVDDLTAADRFEDARDGPATLAEVETFTLLGTRAVGVSATGVVVADLRVATRHGSAVLREPTFVVGAVSGPDPVQPPILRARLYNDRLGDDDGRPDADELIAEVIVTGRRFRFGSAIEVLEFVEQRWLVTLDFDGSATPGTQLTIGWDAVGLDDDVLLELDIATTVLKLGSAGSGGVPPSGGSVGGGCGTTPRSGRLPPVILHALLLAAIGAAVWRRSTTPSRLGPARTSLAGPA